ALRSLSLHDALPIFSSDTVRVSFGSCSVKWGFYRRCTEQDPNNIRTKPLFCSRCSFLLPDRIRTVTGPPRARTGKRGPTPSKSLFMWISLRRFVSQNQVSESACGSPIPLKTKKSDGHFFVPFYLRVYLLF